jgi:AraC-like DNA-binding protein
VDFKGGSNHDHRHSHFETCIVLAGSGTFDHGEDSFGVEPGDMFTAVPGTTHRIVSARSDSLELVFFSFEFLSTPTDDPKDAAGRVESELVRRFRMTPRMLVSGCLELATYFERLAAIPVSNTDLWYVRSQATCKALLLEVLARSCPPQPARSGIVPERTDPRVEMALSYIDDNVQTPISVSDVAVQAATSPRTLRRLFVQHVGRSIVAEIARRRVFRAAELLLLDRQESIARIADRLHYSDPSVLNRDFRKYVGSTPREYRVRGAAS